MAVLVAGSTFPGEAPGDCLTLLNEEGASHDRRAQNQLAGVFVPYWVDRPCAWAWSWFSLGLHNQALDSHHILLVEVGELDAAPGNLEVDSSVEGLEGLVGSPWMALGRSRPWRGLGLEL